MVLCKGLQRATRRSRLVGRGRTIGNRVTGNSVREFESLLLRQRKNHPIGWFFSLRFTMEDSNSLERDECDRRRGRIKGAQRSGGNLACAIPSTVEGGRSLSCNSASIASDARKREERTKKISPSPPKKKPPNRVVFFYIASSFNNLITSAKLKAPSPFTSEFAMLRSFIIARSRVNTSAISALPSSLKSFST